LLFDAGPGAESTHAGERIVVPYLQAHGVSRLDALIVSHDDSDHAGGADAVLDAIAIDDFVASIAPEHRLWDSARRRGARVLRCAAGQRWRWDGVDFEVLWPDAAPLAGNSNKHCCVLRVATAARSAQAEPIAALLAADVETTTERTLMARAADRLRAQVLVVPHHGSRTSSTEPFLDSVWPLVAVFQVGYANRFHHPHPDVYARYVLRHIVLTRSDTDGAVRIEAGPEASEAALEAGQQAGPGALVVERFIDTQRRYWMDAQAR
jgi:competence protein ComEC